MAEKKDPIRNLIDSGRRAGKLTSTEISDAMEEAGNVLEVEAMEKLYEELESNGIEVIDDTPVEVDDTVAAPDDGADGDDAVVFAGGRQLLAGEGHFEGAGNADDGQVFL